MGGVAEETMVSVNLFTQKGKLNKIWFLVNILILHFYLGLAWMTTPILITMQSIVSVFDSLAHTF